MVATNPADAGWRYVHFAAHRLREGSMLRGDSGSNETALIVLGGSCQIQAGHKAVFDTAGRRDIWDDSPPHVVLLPPDTPYSVRARGEVHLAVAGAPAESGRPPRHIQPEEMLVEHRGEGHTYRRVQHLLPPSADAAKLILVEVYTPGGNWSSFPPHKHDTEDPPRESALEELYYFGVRPSTGFALQRVYTDDGELEEALSPGDGDLVLVPRGYHVVAATPGHECYYLNVMAGPSRAWNFTLDPAYAALMNWQKPANS